MPVTLAQLRGVIHAEYESLVERLRLSPLPLDVYEIDDSGNGDVTSYGTNTRNDTPGYTPTRIVLPQAPGDLLAWNAAPPTFPPTIWNRHTDDWPAWRTDLWHEVIHQYQHQIIKNWDPKDTEQGHGIGWHEAIRRVATNLSITSEQLLGVL